MLVVLKVRLFFLAVVTRSGKKIIVEGRKDFGWLFAYQNDILLAACS